MAEYYQFAHSVQGYNHIKANKVCQDASGECHFEDVSIIAVADGHGSDNYIRTDRGSKFAVSAALTAIKAFVQEARENHLSTVPDSETELIQVSKNILARWYTQVENDVACEPFQPEELAKVSEKYKQRYASGQYNAKAYGTTLIAVCMTSEGWFGIHIGDGKCVELLENGTLCEPIPWDEACEQNITTSICDSDAIEEFRYVIQKDFPAAIFIGSDGIDDSYRVKKKARGSRCLLCGKKTDGFCKSHSVPQFSLKYIAESGMVFHPSIFMDIEQLDVEKGVMNSGIFQRICRECDGRFFQDYENERNLQKH